ncbi:MAG: DUF6249 domain-containing protein [Pseudomonadota bacterium]
MDLDVNASIIFLPARIYRVRPAHHNVERHVRRDALETVTQDAGPLDELIPIVFALVLGAIVISAQWLIYRLKRTRIDAVRDALARRTDLDPDRLAALIVKVPSPRADLRRAMLWLAFGTGLFVVGLAAPPEARRLVFGIAAVPGFVSLAYFAFFALRLQDEA